MAPPPMAQTMADGDEEEDILARWRRHRNENTGPFEAVASAAQQPRSVGKVALYFVAEKVDSWCSGHSGASGGGAR